MLSFLASCLSFAYGLLIGCILGFVGGFCLPKNKLQEWFKKYVPGWGNGKTKKEKKE